MATKKNIKTAKKIAKKAKKNKGLTVIIILLLLVVIGVVGFFGYKEYTNATTFVSDFDGIEETINISENVTENLTLPSEYNGHKLQWSSSNTDVIATDGKVTRCSYLEGDKNVVLTLTIEYEPATFLYDFIKGFLPQTSYEQKFTILVKALEPTDEDLIDDILNQIYMPTETYTSIGLASNTCYDNITMEWISSNPSVMSNAGVVTRPATDTEVTLTLKCKSDTTEKQESFKVKVLANDFEFYAVDSNFDDLNPTSKYQDVKAGEITYKNARVIADPTFDFEAFLEANPEETNAGSYFLKLRTRDVEKELASFETGLIDSPDTLTFNYEYDKSAKKSDDIVKFVVYARNDKSAEYAVIKEEAVVCEEGIKTLTVDLSSYEIAQVKVELQYTTTSTAQTRDVTVNIDNVQIKLKGLTKEEISSTLNIPASVSRSILLPFTTKYGGSVTWESSDSSVINNNGALLVKVTETRKVTLTATIDCGGLHLTKTFEVTLVGASSKTNVEVYFIDIGKYGVGDCGECTYIKYNDIDIIVDGGDHFAETNKAICEVFDSHTNDKVIDYLVATHPDADHIGGLPALFEEYQINNVYKFYDGECTTQKLKNFKAAIAAEPNCNCYEVYSDVFVNKTVSSIINIDGNDIYIEFIDTGFLTDKESNGRSVVFKLVAYGKVLLMTGDADNGGSHTKLEVSYKDKVGDIDILKAVHHATANGCVTEFLEATKPEVVVVCNGNYLGNKHSHPTKTALDRLNSYDASMPIYAITGGGINAEKTKSGEYEGGCTLEESRIDRNGTITLLINDTGYTFSSEYYDSDIKDIRDTQYWNIIHK